MGELRQQLVNFTIQEETPVELIFNEHPILEIFKELDLILTEGQPEAIAHALGFIRDANLYKHPFRDDFQTHLACSKIWDALQKLLEAPNFSVRGNAIYTIAKLTNRNRAGLLSAVFDYYLENDPIHLPYLIREHVWLTNEWNWDFIEQVAAARSNLKRWCLCQLLDDRGDQVKILENFIRILNPLKNDPHPLVSAEANWRFERITIKLGPKLPKPEWRQAVKRIATLQPPITFEATAMKFMYERLDYSLEEFDRYVTSLI